MKIKISKIKVGKHSIRDEVDEEHIREIRESFKIDGQWHPIIVRRDENGSYDLIAGHCRLKAAQELGWEEIEATIKDLEDIDADVLSLKTNFMHTDLSPTEKGKVINKIITTYGISQKELSIKLGISQAQTSKLLTLALSLHKSVADALNSGTINYGVASVIGTLEINQQPRFLKIIIEKKITQPSKASSLKAKFLSDKIYTIGYQGKNLDFLIEILKKNKINLLIDIRDSGKSSNKPEFNSEILKREFNKINIKYTHKPELGIIYQVRAPYIEGYIDDNAFRGWYNWHLDNIGFNVEDFIEFLKNNGNSCLMCMEGNAKPNKNQKHHCHRDFLADIILNHKSKDSLLLFERRIDL